MLLWIINHFNNITELKENTLHKSKLHSPTPKIRSLHTTFPALGAQISPNVQESIKIRFLNRHKF
jgi:hypothetical protein